MGGPLMGIGYRFFKKFAIIYVLILGLLFPSATQPKKKIKNIHDLAKIINQQTNQSPDYFHGIRLSDFKNKHNKKFRSFNSNSENIENLSQDVVNQINQKLKNLSALNSKERTELFKKIDKITESVSSRTFSRSRDDNWLNTEWHFESWIVEDSAEFWRPMFIGNFSYENDLVVERLYLLWNNETQSLDNWLRRSYEYNENGNLLEQLYLNWNEGVWENSSQYSFSYDINGNLIEELRQFWNGSNWENGSLDSYSYDENGNQIEELQQDWNGSNWDNNSLFSFSYDESGNQTEELQQYWNGSNWDNGSLDSYSYDENGNQTEELQQDWNGSNWENSGLYSYLNNNNGNQIEQLYQNWNGNDWEDSGLYTNLYDNNGNQIEQLYYYWNGSEWENGNRNVWAWELGTTQYNEDQTAWELSFEGGVYPRSIANTSDGGYIAGGYTCEYGCDFWLLKTASNGTVEWETSFGGSQFDILLSLKESTDGGFVFTGYTDSPEYTNSENYSPFLAKTDSDGNILWIKEWGYEGEGRSLALTQDGGYVIGAYAYYETDNFLLLKTDENGELTDMVLQSTGSFGSICWDNCIQQTTSGEYIVVSNLFDSDTEESTIGALKFNSSFQNEWGFGYGSRSSAYSVQNTSDGGFIISGHTEYSPTFGGFVYPTSWILKIDQNGASEWDQIYGRGTATSVQQTSDGGFITVGWITDIDPYGYWNNYAMITKADESGIQIWQNIFEANSLLNSVVESETGGYTAVGSKNFYAEGFMIHISDDGTTPQDPQDECGGDIDGYSYLGSFNNSCYYLSDNTMYWFDARQACENAGGHLATITSSEESSYLTDELGIDLEINPWGPWIGLSDHEEENDWRWVTDEPFSFTAWSGGEPGVDSPEDHATWSTGGWHDHPNERNFNYILEVPGEPIDDDNIDLSGLFFSEYGEGSGNNKYLEIYNNTGQTVNLDDVVILGNYNGNPWSETFTFDSGAVLENENVYVLASNQADEYILSHANEIHGYADPWYVTAFNGDDIRALAQIADQDTTILDIIGTFDGGDPGDGWLVAGTEVATQNHTLVRKDYVDHGNGGDWNMSAGSDPDNSEWVVLEQDNWDYIGSHPHEIEIPFTVNITFIADMTHLIDQDEWDIENNYLEIRGDMNGWNEGDVFYHDSYDNLYYLNKTITAYEGDQINWKFKAHPGEFFLYDGWEFGPDRIFNIFTDQDMTLGPFQPNILPQGQINNDVSVEFHALWRDGTYNINTGEPFPQAPDTIVVNGSFLSCWCTWGDCMGSDCEFPSSPELPRLTDPDGDGVYSGTLFLQAGHTNVIPYKLGAYYPGVENDGGLDNEGGWGMDKYFLIDQEASGSVVIETVFGDNNPANDFLTGIYVQEEPFIAEGWSMVARLSFDEMGDTFIEDSGPRTVIGGMDMDQDGIDEIIVTEYSGNRVIVMEFNPGTNQFNEVWSSPVLSDSLYVSNPRTVGVGDLDNDGRQEIVFPSVQINNQGWHIYEWDGNVGSDNYGTQPSSINRNELDICCPVEIDFRGDHERTTIDDVDNDGKQELVIMIRRGSPRGTLITSVEGDIIHNGGGQEEWITEFFVDAELYDGGSPYHSLPADLNGDGHTDLINHTWNNLHFYNITSTGPNEYQTQDPGADGSYFQATETDQVSLFGGDAADVDGDGNDEAYFVSYGSWGVGSGDVYVVDYDSGDDVLTINSEHVVKIANGLGQSGAAMGSIYDLDANGLSNIITSEYPAMVRSLESNGNPRDMASYSSSVVYDHNTPVSVEIIDSLGILSVNRIGGAWISKTQSHYNGSYLDFDNDGKAEMLISFQGDPDYINIDYYTWNPDSMGWSSTDNYSVQNNNHSFIALIENDNIQIQTNQFALGISESGGIPGDTVKVSVWMEMPIDYEMFSYQVSVTGFGGDLLNFVSADTLGSVTPDNWLFAYSQNSDDGIVITAGAGAESITNSGNLFNLTFVLSETVDNGEFVELFILDADVNEDSEINLDFEGGGISVLTYGDVSLNGIVTPFDASLILQYLVGTTDLDNSQLSTGDVTEDNTLSALDAAKILDFTVGIIPSLPVDNENIELAQGYLNIPGGSYTPGDIFSMPILLESGENIRTFEIELGYNPDDLIFHSINWDNSVGGMSIVDNHEEGLIRVSAAGVGTLSPGSFSLATIEFEMPSSFQNQETIVSINRSRLNEQDILVNEASAVFTNGLLIVDDWGHGGVPKVFSLEQNFPNPFNPITQIRYQLPKQTNVSIRVHDIMGRLVKKLVSNQTRLAGFHQITWDATNNNGDPVSAGMYLYVIQTKEFTDTHKMVLMK